MYIMEAVAETTPVVNVSHQYDEMVAWARWAQCLS